MRVIVVRALVMMSSFSEIAIDPTESTCSMTDPIFLCVLVSQNDTDVAAAAAINLPLGARAMHLG